MFKQGIAGVDFVVCNTDSQALEKSPVPIKIQLGVSLTEGLGAGANPEIGSLAAKESEEELISLLSNQTKWFYYRRDGGERELAQLYNCSNVKTT